MSGLRAVARRGRLVMAGLVLAGACAGAPIAADHATWIPPASTWLFTATQLLALAALATAWGTIRTQLDRVDLGHALYVGIGAYVAGAALGTLSWSPPAAVGFAALAASAVGTAAGVVARRLPAPAFALTTVALLVAGRELVRTATPLTRGPQGLALPPVVTPRALYEATLAILLVTIIGAVVAARTRPGHPSAAAPTRRRCMTVCALAGAASGSVGALWASQQLFIDADSAFSLARSFDVVWAALVGGPTIWGPMVGAGLLIGVREAWPVGAVTWRPLAEAAVVLLVALHLPAGVTRLRPGTKIRPPRSGERPDQLAGPAAREKVADVD
ncbi:MAG: branched-chain amino acid ABC transporter permease [Euzebyales bacterium]|nr:branched-chain amino acid ABC transporter permease [Euzebyales bacterium]